MVQRKFRVFLAVIVALAMLPLFAPSSLAAASRDTIAAIANGEVGNSEANGGCLKYGPCRSYEWCAMFAGWVWKTAGVPEVPTTWVATSVGQWGVDRGLFKRRPAGGRGEPLPGDIVVYGEPGSGSGGHVSIVYSVNANGTITTIDGNSIGEAVVRNTINPTTARAGFRNVLISGYVTPPGVSDAPSPIPPKPQPPMEDVHDARVPVDFNGDGKDDTGAFYAYPDGTVGLHQFLSTGAGITGGLVWQSRGADWDWSRVKLTAGDYNADGRGDVGAFYNYPDGTVGLHQFLSTGTGVTGGLVWQSRGADWDWNRVKLLSGDFNADGKDDTGVFYNYPDGTVGLHQFLSTGAGITGGLVWQSRGGDWDWNRIKVTSGDYNGDGKDDTGVFYNYPDETVGLHHFYSTGTGVTGGLVWQSHGDDWDWNRVKISSGDYNGDGKDDTGVFYNYPDGTVGLHQFLSTGAGITGGLVWQSRGSDWDWNRIKVG